eukprot:365764-Chlamydomonas_euryale.AAC.8
MEEGWALRPRCCGVPGNAAQMRQGWGGLLDRPRNEDGVAAACSSGRAMKTGLRWLARAAAQ